MFLKGAFDQVTNVRKAAAEEFPSGPDNYRVNPTYPRQSKLPELVKEIFIVFYQFGLIVYFENLH